MNWKNRLWQFFLAIVVGATLSVCNSAMDTNNFEAIAGSISDGSNQGYMRIGNLQLVFGEISAISTTSSCTSVSFTKNFSATPKIVFGENKGGTNYGGDIYALQSSLSTTGFSVCGSGSTGQTGSYLAIGLWQ